MPALVERDKKAGKGVSVSFNDGRKERSGG
jgi:hypothetical protein